MKFSLANYTNRSNLVNLIRKHNLYNSKDILVEFFLLIDDKIVHFEDPKPAMTIKSLQKRDISMCF